MINAAMSLMLPKVIKVIESNVQNPELNKVIPPLIKDPSCEEQLPEIRKKYQTNTLK